MGFVAWRLSESASHVARRSRSDARPAAREQMSRPGHRGLKRHPKDTFLFQPREPEIGEKDPTERAYPALTSRSKAKASKERLGIHIEVKGSIELDRPA